MDDGSVRSKGVDKRVCECVYVWGGGGVGGGQERTSVSVLQCLTLGP